MASSVGYHFSKQGWLARSISKARPTREHLDAQICLTASEIPELLGMHPTLLLTGVRMTDGVIPDPWISMLKDNEPMREDNSTNVNRNIWC